MDLTISRLHEAAKEALQSKSHVYIMHGSEGLSIKLLPVSEYDSDAVKANPKIIKVESPLSILNNTGTTVELKGCSHACMVDLLNMKYGKV